MKGIYSSREAAEHLGISLPLLKHHLYLSKRFKGFGTILGRSLLFTEDDLAGMKAILEAMPSGGKQPKGTPISNHQARQGRALELQRAGQSLAEIAKELGYSSTSSAGRAIRQAQARKPKKR